MKKLMFYPFTYKNREVLMYHQYIKNYELSVAVTLNDTDKKVFENQFQGNLDVQITSDFEEALGLCNSVYFLHSDEVEMPVEHYIRLIERAECEGKEIMISRRLQEMLPQNYIIPDTRLRLSEVKDTEREYLKHIDVPVVEIMGLGNYCNKFCTELEIAHYFREQGYKVLHFGSKETAVIFGGTLLPEFLFDQSVTTTGRILGWNHYLFHQCDIERPDLIVVGVPGGIMPFNHKILNDFGEVPFILSNGISVDIGVLCLYYSEKMNGENLENYRKYCKYHLKCDLRYANVSNTSCTFYADSRESEVDYLHYDSETTNNLAVEGESRLELFQILDGSSKKNLLNKIYTELVESISLF